MMKPVNGRSTVDLNALSRSAASEAQQGRQPGAPARAPAGGQGPSPVHVPRDAMPPQPVPAPRVEHTADRMHAFIRTNQTITLFSDDLKILSLLPRYAAGEDISDLRKECPSLSRYLCDVGLADTLSAQQFLSRLTPQQRADLKSAIEERISNRREGQDPVAKRLLLANLERQFAVAKTEESSLPFPDDAKVLSLLPRYAAGEHVSSLKKECGSLSAYLTDSGVAKKPSARYFLDRLSKQQRETLENAIKLREIFHRLVDITAAFAKPSSSLESVARTTKVKVEHLRQVLTESGLTELGEQMLSNHKVSHRHAIEYNVKLRGSATVAAGTSASHVHTGGLDAPVLPVAPASPAASFFAGVSGEWRALGASQSHGVTTKQEDDFNSTASQPQTPVSQLASVPSQFTLGDLEGHFDSTASRPQTPASHLSEIPSQFTLQDLEGHFDSTASRPPSPASHHSEIPSRFTLQDLEGYFDSTASRPPSPAVSGFDLNAPPSPEVQPQRTVGEVRPAPEIVDVDNYPSPPPAISNAAQRLAGNAWLSDRDLFNFTRMLAQRLHGQRDAELLNFVDPQQVRALVGSNVQLRSDVLRRLVGPDTPPILFLPVNDSNRHWSLLVVNRHTAQAFHYDSMVDPTLAHRATNTSQFGVANRVAQALGVGTPAGMPMARQADMHSCGDHVLMGIEVLARRILRREVFRPGGMDLDMIQPQRGHIVDELTLVEQFDAAGQAAPEPQPPQDLQEPKAKRIKRG